jgi:hypothetical protein
MAALEARSARLKPPVSAVCRLAPSPSRWRAWDVEIAEKTAMPSAPPSHV